MTIKQRLALFVCIAIFFIGVSAGTGWYFFAYRIGNINLLKDEIGRISNLTIEGRVLEKRFLQFLKPEYLAEFNAKCKNINSGLESLKNSHLAESSREKISIVEDLFHQYQSLFSNILKKTEENNILEARVIKPVASSRQLLSEMQAKISEKQLELQMEGEDLDSSHVGLVVLISEGAATLFRLQSLQQQYLNTGDEKLLDDCKKILDKEGKELPEGMKQFSVIIKDDMLVKNSEKISASLNEFSQLLDTLKVGYNEEQTLLAKLDEAGNKVIDGVVALKTSANEVIAAEKKLAYSYLLIVFIFSVLVFVVTSVFISIRITRPINELTEVVKEIALGNIEVKITHESKDEIGIMTEAFKEMVAEQQKKVTIAKAISEGDFTNQIDLLSEKDSLGVALNSMTISLAEVIKSINICGAKVSSIATRVSDVSESLSDGSVRSASSLQELSSSLTEIGSQANSNAESALNASKLAAAAMGSAQNGNDKMQDLTRSMEEIKNSSDKISLILKVIEDIAFQTNLLALNAAVEAARAGRHGKGFAVVADEVRNLAARSAKAARETAELIEASSCVVEDGREITRHTAIALSEIVESITKTTDLVQKISEASSEQANGVSNVNTGLEQIDKVTQQNAMEAEKSSNDSQELASQANELQILLSRFKLPEV